MKRTSRPREKFAYHTSTQYGLESGIASQGLLPSARSIKRRGEALVFFTDGVGGAARYFIDRESPVLLRFPWPKAYESDDGEYITRLPVPAEQIDVYRGPLLEKLAELYWMEEEDRWSALESVPSIVYSRVERSDDWVPVVLDARVSTDAEAVAAARALRAVKKAPKRNPELLKKGTRLTGSFSDDGSGWIYSGDYPSPRGQRWVASLGLSRGELSVEGATEYDPAFRTALVQMASQYPELLGLEARFDGPRVPISDLVQSDVPTIEETSWLHGTASAAIDSIRASGLRPRGETGVPAAFVGAAAQSRPQYVYLTTQRNMARMAARAAARSAGGVPVVLRIAPLPVSRMSPDEDSGRDTAEESLWRVGSVAYEGSIGPSQIVVDEVLKDGEWSAPVSNNRRGSRRPKRTSRRSR